MLTITTGILTIAVAILVLYGIYNIGRIEEGKRAELRSIEEEHAMYEEVYESEMRRAEKLMEIERLRGQLFGEKEEKGKTTKGLIIGIVNKVIGDRLLRRMHSNPGVRGVTQIRKPDGGLLVNYIVWNLRFGDMTDYFENYRYVGQQGDGEALYTDYEEEYKGIIDKYWEGSLVGFTKYTSTMLEMRESTIDDGYEEDDEFAKWVYGTRFRKLLQEVDKTEGNEGYSEVYKYYNNLFKEIEEDMDNMVDVDRGTPYVGRIIQDTRDEVYNQISILSDELEKRKGQLERSEEETIEGQRVKELVGEMMGKGYGAGEVDYTWEYEQGLEKRIEEEKEVSRV